MTAVRVWTGSLAFYALIFVVIERLTILFFCVGLEIDEEEPDSRNMRLECYEWPGYYDFDWPTQNIDLIIVVYRLQTRR